VVPHIKGRTKIQGVWWRKLRFGCKRGEERGRTSVTEQANHEEA
jgi:hypothetical protein